MNKDKNPLKSSWKKKLKTDKKNNNNLLDLVGYCGTNCSKCEVYQATISNDPIKKSKIAEETEFFTKKKISPKDIFCVGCRNQKSKRKKYLGIKNCTILSCATEKEVISCAHCNYFPCSKFIDHYRSFSLKPKKTVIKMHKKMLRLGNYGENSNNWLKKEKKY